MIRREFAESNGIEHKISLRPR